MEEPTPSFAKIEDVPEYASALGPKDVVEGCQFLRDRSGSAFVECQDRQRLLVYGDDEPVSPSACRRSLRHISPETVQPGRRDVQVPGPAYSYQGRAYTRTGTMPYHAVCFPSADSLSMVVGTAPDRVDPLLFGEFTEAVAYNGIPDDVTVTSEVEEVFIAGQRVLLPGPCSTRGEQNVTCYPNGQLSWDTHRTILEAAGRMDTQITGTQMPGTPVERTLAEDTPACTFLEEEVECRRLVYEMDVGPNSDPNTSDLLVAYYIWGKVNETPVSSICSFFTTQATSEGLSELCKYVLTADDAEESLQPFLDSSP